jgi:hypothetical protein
MNLERTCILFVKSLIHHKQQKLSPCKSSWRKGVGISIRNRLKCFFYIKTLFGCSTCCQLQHVQIWIQDSEIIKFKMKNCIQHHLSYTYFRALYSTQKIVFQPLLSTQCKLNANLIFQDSPFKTNLSNLLLSTIAINIPNSTLKKKKFYFL